MKRTTGSTEEFVDTVFKVVERMGGRRPSGAWGCLDLAAFTCGEEAFLAALGRELGSQDSVRPAGWPHFGKWAAYLYSPEPVIFEFTRPALDDGMVRGIRMLSCA
jgi:hypothetical protein